MGDGEVAGVTPNASERSVLTVDRTITVHRHKTALSRATLSRSMQLALAADLIHSEATVLDYGSGLRSDCRSRRRTSGSGASLAGSMVAMQHNRETLGHIFLRLGIINDQDAECPFFSW